jgi:hypothetical protein
MVLESNGYGVTVCHLREFSCFLRLSNQYLRSLPRNIDLGHQLGDACVGTFHLMS